MPLSRTLLDRVPGEVLRLGKLLPRFQDGRIDYTNARRAPVLDCYVFWNSRLLILNRTRPIAAGTIPWHVVSGFLDTERSLREQVHQEFEEEIGLFPEFVHSLFSLEPYRHFDGKLWTVYPVLARLRCDWPIRLNEEHVGFRWIDPARMNAYLAPQVCRAIQSKSLRLISRSTPRRRLESRLRPRLAAPHGLILEPLSDGRGSV